MRNITGQAVVGDDLYGRDYELARIWERLDQGEHLMMLAPRRVGKTSLMLELHRAPHENWDVVYVDVQSGDSAADCVAATLSALAAPVPSFEAGSRQSRFRRLSRTFWGVCPPPSISACCASNSRAQLVASGAMPRISSRRGSPGCRILAAICWSSSTSCRFSFRECCARKGRYTMRSCCCPGSDNCVKRRSCVRGSARSSVDRSGSKALFAASDSQD